MTSNQIEKNVNSLVKKIDQDEFIYDLLLSYGISKTSVTRLKKGDFNLAKNEDEVLYKKKVFFKKVKADELLTQIDEISKNKAILNHNPRFVIVTDFKTLLAKDINTGQSLDIDINKLDKHFDFFLPWAGQEKYLHRNEDLADRKASYEMAKLYDILVHENPNIYDDGGHKLNIFLSRLLFCFFAEDTDIFHEEGVFTTTLAQHTEENGNNVAEFLNRLFERLNSENPDRFPAFLKAFPYVNGGLFRDNIESPIFSKKARQIILECGDLNWSEINPDIFGSMIQAVVNPEYRSGLGMHYTSVPNIMKVIEPLFLNELNEEFEKYKDRPNMLRRLINRISKIKIFDPACGSGNFLIIAYKELRRLEIQILTQLNEIQPQQSIVFTEIKLSQFYGIEVDDFAHEMAILSLWLAEHQMNKEFEEGLYDFGKSRPILPLKEAGYITCGNATRLDWKKICPIDFEDEVFVLGNPPYLGARLQDENKKEDMNYVFHNLKGYNNMDYISCWFYKAKEYINDKNARFSFVSTNSVCQGEQVALIWPHILSNDVEIDFAYQSFKWTNNAKGNAGVTVVIVGLRNVNNEPKHLFLNTKKKRVKNINAYLIEGKNMFIKGRTRPLSSLPDINFGNMANDGGNLLLSREEKDELILKEPNSEPLIKRFMGALEFIRGKDKYCLWIESEKKDLAYSLPAIQNRIEKTKQNRLKSKRKATKDLAKQPHAFGEIRHVDSDSIIIPRHSSESREYIPIGFFNSDTIIADSALAIYNAEPWIFGLLSSKMHMVWVKSVGGQLETRIRYSAKVCYNTFPFPEISQKQKELLNLHVFEVLEEREKHSSKTLAQLYDPDKMPEGLMTAHRELDLAVERCYRLKPFQNDIERLEYLFKEYEKLTNKS